MERLRLWMLLVAIALVVAVLFATSGSLPMR